MQICTCHQLLHPQVLQLLIKLFETEHSQLDVMEQVRLHLNSQMKSVGSHCDADMLVIFQPPDGAEENSSGQDGSPAEPRLRPARGGIHQEVSGEAQHRHLPHSILCH